ncbi:MAG: hypothetical protein B7X90_17050 [Novosphingobium sp. 17-62-19]|uniref:hypothetical protein n=1 Tax=Novosphingobium sp. 17-62-19 TaxID=1970406 RepID=UPI000BD68085|nr:hypothetical protein [Novosphingobium sp. 17-62-19]OYX93128.1 MAG: hypothetical protein B7Y74_10425 [Novosphingobium sp. 35-62-5]OZA16829.1 MAG: hypothetical protein B7X90_17050 [Novosphingobium sp. 17-62-19]HQS97227.1 hypothetical protein [Novosphingobium sp.]
MSKSSTIASAVDARRAHVEALLAAYPDVTPDEHALLITWFKREASALDVALVASNPAAERGYRKFRAEHVDRFTVKDMVRALVFAAVVAALVLLAVAGAPV